MTYSQHSLRQRNKKLKKNAWAYKEGVILYPNGKWIARVSELGRFKTLSQHPTQEEAQKVYNTFQAKKEGRQVPLEDLTSKEIVSLVKAVTGELITYSLKSKKSIINKANQLLC